MYSLFNVWCFGTSFKGWLYLLLLSETHSTICVPISKCPNSCINKINYSCGLFMVPWWRKELAQFYYFTCNAAGAAWTVLSEMLKKKTPYFPILKKIFFSTIFPTPLWVSSPFLPQVGLYSVRVTASPVWWAYSHGCPLTSACKPWRGSSSMCVLWVIEYW